MPANHLILCRPLLLLPPIFPSFRVVANESAFRIRWPKYGGFGFSISPCDERLGLVSLRLDQFDLAVLGPQPSLILLQKGCSAEQLPLEVGSGSSTFDLSLLFGLWPGGPEIRSCVSTCFCSGVDDYARDPPKEGYHQEEDGARPITTKLF